jgi:hypothetical protein
MQLPAKGLLVLAFLKSQIDLSWEAGTAHTQCKNGL